MQTREIHYWYGISYLVTAIIALIAFGLFNVPNLVDKISFALTITSLVLAVVAIIYTFMAANKQESQLANLLETNHKISSASVDIQRVASTLVGHISEIPIQFESLGSKIDKISLSSSQLLQKESGHTEAANFGVAEFRNFLVGLPFVVMAALYLFYRAQMSSNTINSSTVENLDIASYDFVMGAYSAISPTGLIQFKFHKNEIVPVSCAQVVSDNLRSELEKIISVINEDQAELMKVRLQKIDLITGKK